jgi:hypothetical protein
MRTFFERQDRFLEKRNLRFVGGEGIRNLLHYCTTRYYRVFTKLDEFSPNDLIQSPAIPTNVLYSYNGYIPFLPKLYVDFFDFFCARMNCTTSHHEQ